MSQITHIKVPIEILVDMRKVAVQKKIFLQQATTEALSAYLQKNRRYLEEFKLK